MIYGRESILKDDLERMSRLSQHSRGWLEFQVDFTCETYLVTLNCNGRHLRNGIVEEVKQHRVAVHLGPNYPVEAPMLVWQTPVFHPNIRTPAVCLLGQWGAKTRLDEVCIWLWDMARYKLYNLNDPLNQAAGRWAQQHEGEFPVDDRDLRAAAA